MNFFAIQPLVNRYPSLHALRLAGIILVVQIHMTKVFLNEKIFLLGSTSALALRCLFSMDLFFFLSGFLIAQVGFSSHENFSRRSFVRFYARRGFRIVPVYYFVLGLNALFYGVNDSQSATLYRELLFLSNYPTSQKYLMPWSWSLSVEEHFYLLVPFLLWGLSKIRSRKHQYVVLGALWISGLAVRLFIYFKNAPWTDSRFFVQIYTTTHCRYDLFVAGIFVAFFLRDFGKEMESFFETPSRLRWLLVPPAVVFLLFMSPWDLSVKPFPPPDLAHVFYLGTFTSVAYGCLTVYLLYAKTRFVSFCSNRFFLYSATLGYGIYLVHIPVVRLLVVPLYHALNLTASPIVWFWGLALTLFVSAAITYVIHLLVEKPFLYLRDVLFQPTIRQPRSVTPGVMTAPAAPC